MKRFIQSLSLSGSLSLIVLLAMAIALISVSNVPAQTVAATHAPAGFDGKTNGFLSQNLFDKAKDVFAEVEDIDEGVGPLFNATSCADCHHTPVVGGGSQVTELRAASFDGKNYEDHPGGSLINDRSLDPSIQERTNENYNVRTFRGSLSILGDGFVEAIADSTLVAISNSQPAIMRGHVINVPVLEANGALRVGRFGWKNQHASLESFAADAYLNEMGITSPLQPQENTSNGHDVASYDSVPDPEDDGADVRQFAQFMRSTKVPPRDETIANSADGLAGSLVFDQIGCDTCHVRRIVTAPAGTVLNGGAFTVPPALGNKVIQPFGDFLLHDVGTGDGIVQNGGRLTMNKVRTAPLWGLRTRTRLMHDGASVSPNDAILRHRGEAVGVLLRYQRLSNEERRLLLVFLNSL